MVKGAFPDTRPHIALQKGEAVRAMELMRS